jgi:hypothetical protein
LEFCSYSYSRLRFAALGSVYEGQKAIVMVNIFPPIEQVRTIFVERPLP